MDDEYNSRMKRLSAWWDKHANTVHESKPSPAGLDDPTGERGGLLQFWWIFIVAIIVFLGMILLFVDSYQRSFFP